MLRRDFAKALIGAGVGIAAPSANAADDLLELDGVQRLAVKPGDVICLSFPHVLSHEAANNVREHLRPIFPDNKIMILCGGMEISVAGTGA